MQNTFWWNLCYGIQKLSEHQKYGWAGDLMQSLLGELPSLCHQECWKCNCCHDSIKELPILVGPWWTTNLVWSCCNPSRLTLIPRQDNTANIGERAAGKAANCCRCCQKRSWTICCQIDERELQGRHLASAGDERLSWEFCAPCTERSWEILLYKMCVAQNSSTEKTTCLKYATVGCRMEEKAGLLKEGISSCSLSLIQFCKL